MTIKIAFGCLAPKLHEQLPISRRKLRYLQECADGIAACSIGGLLSDAEIDRARRRIVKRIMKTFSTELRQTTALSGPKDAA